MNPWSMLVIGVVCIIAVLLYTLPDRSTYLTDVSEPPVRNTETTPRPEPVAHTQTVDQPSIVEPPRPEFETLLGELSKYKKCYVEGTCVTPESDPRGAHSFVAQQLTERLHRLVELAHYSQVDPSLLAETAREFLAFPDGHVQEQALLLMGTMSPAQGNAEAIISALKGHHDGRLFELALVELQRYPNAYRIIDDFLIETLRTGGHYASQTVARQLLPILRKDNFERYETIAAELPQNTAKARYLKQVLNEYRLLQQGG